MYSLARKMLTFIMTFLLLICAAVCCFLRECFVSEKVDAFLQKNTFVTNLYFIASIFALAAFLPWFVRYIDFQRTNADVKEKDRIKRSHISERGVTKTSTTSLSLFAGLPLAVIFFLISRFFLGFAVQFAFLLGVANILCCFCAIYKAHLEGGRFSGSDYDPNYWKNNL